MLKILYGSMTYFKTLSVMLKQTMCSLNYCALIEQLWVMKFVMLFLIFYLLISHFSFFTF